ncbi:MAG: adenylate/guanylate cyclase domain-containing protein [Microthrixaceae bacterium]
MATEPNLIAARAAVRGMVLIQVAANGLGVVVVMLYFQFLLPRPDVTFEDRQLNLLVFAIYLAVVFLIALPINAALLGRAVSWVREDRPPGNKERLLLFTLPTVETASALLSWIGAAVIFGLINDDFRRVAGGITLAGLVTCTLLYLLLEGHFRPLFALALRHAELPEDRRDVGPRLMMAWLLGSGVPMAAIALANLVNEIPLNPERLAVMGLVSLVAGGLVMTLAARSVTRPVERIRQGLRRIESGDLDVDLPVDDLGELGRLTQGVNNLAAGIREREELRDLFGRQVGQGGLTDLATPGSGSATVGELRDVTVLFVDLQGFTSFAERHSPVEVVEILNRFFGTVVAVVGREGGWINKFEGDAAMCIFGAPQDQPDHRLRALRSAAALPRELARDGGPLSAGIGVASGEVLAGFVGTPERFEYTVIGDVVNVASRLCEAAKSERDGVLAADTTIRSRPESPCPDGWRPAGNRDVRGRRERTAVYALSAHSEPSTRRFPSLPFRRSPASPAPPPDGSPTRT